jgi:hypothetical protein
MIAVDEDRALEELKLAVEPMLHSRHEVEVSTSRTGDGTKECLVLTVEPAGGPSRYLRIHSTDAPERGCRYAWLWSSYRANDESDNCDGRGLGDLQRTIEAIRHWIIDGTRWQDVAEFACPK